MKTSTKMRVSGSSKMFLGRLMRGTGRTMANASKKWRAMRSN